MNSEEQLSLNMVRSGLNHREGGCGIQRAVVQACVVGHFGSRTTLPENCKDFRWFLCFMNQ